MVDLKTAINELNTGSVEFTYKNDGGCTTVGEVVIFLERLQEFENIGIEPDEITEKLSCCGVEQEKNMDYIMKINMWFVDTYMEDLLSRFCIDNTDNSTESFMKLSDIFRRIYEEENKKYPLLWCDYVSIEE